MSKFIIPSTLRELRFHLSQTGEASVPLKSFLSKNYQTLKSQTQFKLPVLIRESYGVSPALVARFEKGREVKTRLDGLDEKQIENALADLLK